MASIRSAYASIDLRSAGTTWPAVIPPMTGPEAVRAAKRLYRFALGCTFTGVVRVSSGNRRADVGRQWDSKGRPLMIVNPDQGWKRMLHDLSHDFDYVANGTSPHSKHHARLEAKLVREVLKRGWLDGSLRDEEPEAPTVDPRITKRQDELRRLAARLLSWQRKQKRAATAMAKIVKRQKLLTKVLAAPLAAPAPRAPRAPVPSVKQLAATHGIEIEKLNGGGYNVWPPTTMPDDDSDPHQLDHYASAWPEVRVMVADYVSLNESRAA